MLRVDGERPECIASGGVQADRWVGRLRIRRPGGDAEGPLLPQDAVEVVVRRRVGRGLAERIELANHSATAYRGELTLELDADFADNLELGKRRHQGRTTRRWLKGKRSLTFDHRAAHDGAKLHRATRLTISSGHDVTWSRGALTFELDLEPRATWSVDLTYASLVDGKWRKPRPAFAPDGTWLEIDQDRRRAVYEERGVQFETPGAHLGDVCRAAAIDLFELRNWDLEAGRNGWVPNAGVPTYTGFFGRDTLTTGWQQMMLGPHISRGALEIASRTQATIDDPWRDAQPGRMVHEMRRGPLSMLNIRPQAAYYGTHTTAQFFVVALSELWHWTNDLDALRRHRDAALRAMEWAEKYGDADGDGLLEYERRSPEGLGNQGWKDSDEAIRHADGSIAEGAIATVEEQAFHCLATQRMAEILVALGENDLADDFAAHAREQRRRFHDAFWMPDAGFYAMALDGDKRQVQSIGSNPGHAIAAGVVPIEQARLVADRLLADDLFSGWGVRTLSRDHPSYNPFGYHLGPVWPVENATFVLAFKRYGLDDHAQRLASAMLEAAECFQGERLPEALSGHARAPKELPTAYPQSNSPQAWSASATIHMVQALLGLYPFAPLGVLTLVRPRLPAAVAELTLRNVRVGAARVSIRFTRREDGSVAHEVVERTGRLIVLELPPPINVGDEGPAWSDRLAGWGLEHAPGRHARALRLALGLLD